MANFTNPDFTTNLSSWTGGYLPTDVSGCRLWLDAGTLSLNDNDLVELWEDGSAQGNDCTASGATRPTFKTNQLNGKPAVYFSGGPYLESSTGMGITGTNARTLFFVAYNINGWVLASIGKSSNAWSPTATNIFMWGYDPSYTVGWTGSQNKVFSQTYASGILNNWENGAIKNNAQDIGTSFNTQNDGYYVGDWFPHSRPMSGNLFEALIYDSELSATNRANVHTYLAFKYQLALTSEGANGTRDTGTKYTGKTASLKVAALTQQNFYEIVNPGSINSFTLSAYAYTDGSPVTSADCELFYDGATVTTTFTEDTDGWYQMTATVTGANANKKCGVQVKAGKTVYFNTFDLTEQAPSPAATGGFMTLNTKWW